MIYLRAFLTSFWICHHHFLDVTLMNIVMIYICHVHGCGDVDPTLHGQNMLFTCTSASHVSLAITNIHKVSITNEPHSLLVSAVHAFHTIAWIRLLNKAFGQHHNYNYGMKAVSCIAIGLLYAKSVHVNSFPSCSKGFCFDFIKLISYSWKFSLRNEHFRQAF